MTDEEEDPELLAKLQAWFGGPFGHQVAAEDAQALEEVDPELVGTSREPGIPDFLRKARQEREETLDAVDMTFVRALETRREAWANFVTAPVPPDPVIDTSIATLNPLRQLEVTIHGIRDREVSDDVTAALRHNTPQALLRDVHRTVEKPPQMILDPLPLGVPKMTGKSTHVTDAMAQCHTIYLEREPQPRKYMAEDMADLHSRIRVEDWEPSDLGGPQHGWQTLPSSEEMLWFAGIDPSRFK